MITVGPRCPLGPGLPGVPCKEKECRWVTGQQQPQAELAAGECTTETYCTQTAPQTSSVLICNQKDNTSFTHSSWLLHLLSFVMFGRIWTATPVPRWHLTPEGQPPKSTQKTPQGWGHLLGPRRLLKSQQTHQGQPKALLLCHPKIHNPLSCWSSPSPSPSSRRACADAHTHCKTCVKYVQNDSSRAGTLTRAVISRYTSQLSCPTYLQIFPHLCELCAKQVI